MESRKSIDSNFVIYKKCGKYSGLDERETDIFYEITGLRVSEGAVVLTKDKCGCVFVDGRYTLAAKTYLNQDCFEISDRSFSAILSWIKEEIPNTSKILYDPRFFSIEYVNKFRENLDEYEFSEIDIEDYFNINKKERTIHVDTIVKTASYDRLSIVRDAILKHNVDAYLISDPCSIAWLLEIRDFSAKYTPVIFGHLLVPKNEIPTFYVDDVYNNVPEISSVKTKSELELQNDIQRYAKVGIDESETCAYFHHTGFMNMKNPCLASKSIKNDTEIKNMKSAAKKDSAAIINFMHWIYSYNGKLTELDAAAKLLQFRKEQRGFIGESFECIAAADANSAIVHYVPTPQTNSVINKILLLDSGGQYEDGTTDITRTFCFSEPTAEQKKYYTLVLKGHIAVANAKLPIDSEGSQLDALARQFLWQNFADYNHGTGHGIGYISHVHEGPITISGHSHTRIFPGTIISNEPGFYKDNEFGIRLENMILTKRDSFLHFETISFVPFDMNFIDHNMLTRDEKSWLNSYHKKIIDKMEGTLSESVIAWLRKMIGYEEL